ncbi:unnamed protein product [Allacma fusca]|uniref:Uncharacterized protein n=1 Tax=Allacma fusca TaxID=39272 RepID=A0A8J2PZ28_9HEXA|nr:unnamed protein product [Allacma fusca]
MGRPAGVGNKTPQELKIEAELLKRKAEMKELERKRKVLQKERQGTVKNAKTPGCQDYAKGGDLYDDELCPGCTSSMTSGAGEVLKWGLMSVVGILATVLVTKKDE